MDSKMKEPFLALIIYIQVLTTEICLKTENLASLYQGNELYLKLML